MHVAEFGLEPRASPFEFDFFSLCQFRMKSFSLGFVTSGHFIFLKCLKSSLIFFKMFIVFSLMEILTIVKPK